MLGDEAFGDAVAVLIDALEQVGSDAGVEDAVAAAGKDVDAGLPLFPHLMEVASFPSYVTPAEVPGSTYLPESRKRL